MDSSIRTTLWAAYAALIVLVIAGLAVTVGILQSANRQDYRVVEGSAPLLQTMNSMDDDVMTMLSAARGYALTGQSAFVQQYDDSVRDFEKLVHAANRLANDSSGSRLAPPTRAPSMSASAISSAAFAALTDPPY